MHNMQTNQEHAEYENMQHTTVSTSICPGQNTNKIEYAKHAECANKQDIKYAEKYVKQYAKYEDTYSDMQNMWDLKYGKYVESAKSAK